MIKNAREYQITKAQAAKFERALAATSRYPAHDPGAKAMVAGLHRDALRSQLDDLRAELDEYEALEAGRLNVVEVQDLDELPRVLIQARIAARLSQRELAERLGMKEQQVQRYEATGYASASLSRILEVVHALGIKLHQDIVLPSADISLETLTKRLRMFGFDPQFVQNRLAIKRGREENDAQTAWKTATAAGRVLGIPPADLFALKPTSLIPRSAAASALFKLPARANETKVEAYAAYAHYLATVTLACTSVTVSGELPSHPLEVYQELAEDCGNVSFEAALRYVWGRGIPVVPLRDSGAFHGAFWRIDGRPVIVLKQQVASNARWLIDLLHEYYHAVQTEGATEAEFIESSDSPHERRNTPEERAATQWASAVVLGCREQELAERCVEEANGEEARMKRAVQTVAAQENVPVDTLANYMAYRLALHDESDWWSTATALQPKDQEPWTIARDVLFEFVEVHRLDRTDRELLARALSNEEN